MLRQFFGKKLQIVRWFREIYGVYKFHRKSVEANIALASRPAADQPILVHVDQQNQKSEIRTVYQFTELIQLREDIISRTALGTFPWSREFSALLVQLENSLLRRNWVDDRNGIDLKKICKFFPHCVESAGLNFENSMLISDIGNVPSYPDLMAGAVGFDKKLYGAVELLLIQSANTHAAGIRPCGLAGVEKAKLCAAVAVFKHH